MQEVPAIYVRRFGASRLSLPSRLLAGLLAIGCLTVLVASLQLDPSPTGVGTHARLGLQECGFLKRTGIPCMSCGMTTSFSHFTRGNLLASLWVQPMGLVLATLTAVGFWAGLYIALTGRPAHRLLRLLPVRYYVWGLIVFSFLAWGWKILIHLTGRDGWS